MPGHPRLRGGKTDNYTVTYNNQVGVDTSIQSDRTIPSYSASVIYVDSTSGLDTNSGLTELLAVKTLAKAFQLAQSGSKTYVVIINDTDVYPAIGIEMTADRQLIAKDGISPIVQFDKSLQIDPRTAGFSTAFCSAENIDSGDVFVGSGTGIWKRNAVSYVYTQFASTSAIGVDGMTLYNDYVYFQAGGGGIVYYIKQDGTGYSTKDVSTYFNDVYGVSAFAGYVFLAGDYVSAESNQQIFALDKENVIISFPVAVNGQIHSVASDGNRCFFSTDEGELYEILNQADGFAFAKIYQFPGAVSAGRLIVSNGAMCVVVSNGISTLTYYINPNYNDNVYNFFNPRISITAAYTPFSKSKNGIILIGDSSNNINYSYDDGITFNSISATNYTALYNLFWSSRGEITILGNTNHIDNIHLSSIYTATYNFVINGVSFDGQNFSDFAISGTDAITSNWCDYYNSYGAIRGGLDGTDKLIADNNKFYDIDYALTVSDKDAIVDADNNVMYKKGTMVYSQFTDSAPLVNLNHNTTNSAKLVKSEVGGFSLNGTTTNIKNNICWNIANPFDVKTDITANSAFDYNLFIAPDDYSQLNFSSGVFSNNPIFNNENSGDLRLQSIAEGYKIDSLYIKGGIGESSDSKDLGAYDVTRTLSSTTFDDDYTFIDPQYVAISIKVPGFGSSENTEGEYSEWSSSSTGYLRREFTIPYNTNTVNSNWYRQIQDIQYLYSQVGNIYQFGYSTNGSAWDSMRSGTGTVSGSDITITYNGEEWGVNKWAGYWVLVDGDYYRITASTAKTSTGSCVLTVDGTPTTGSQAWAIDYILVQLNKQSRIAFTPAVYMGEADYNQAADMEGVVSSYTIKLNEVDSYDV